ncbi:NAD-glutamate dehydrogenase [Altericroceibacterium endophyticum]|nr:NAD-glutamate dehydrogenase domain-containing protein [Altericroceibacterium endophyticum]
MQDRETEDTQLSPAERALAGELSEKICNSLLPGETALDDGPLENASHFLLEAARIREPGKPAILIRSAQDERRVTRIAIINDDMPFLVDSCTALVAEQGAPVDRLLHPVLMVERDANGQLTSISEEESSLRESMIYMETPRLDAKERAALRSGLLSTLDDIAAAVEDWGAMRDRLMQDASSIASEEGAALLKWLSDGQMTQLGHVTRQRDGSQSESMGICRASTNSLLAEESLARAFAWFDDGPGRDQHAPLIIKANQGAQVHRRAPIDLFIIPVTQDGEITALSIHAGLWTSAALAMRPSNVPWLRGQLERIRKDLGFQADSHDAKALIHALTTLPHDLVIGFPDDDIARVATTMMSLVDRPRPKLALVEAPLQRHIFGFVWLPRDMLSTTVRLQVQALLEQETGARTLDWSLVVEGGSLAMLRYVLDIRNVEKDYDEAAIDHQLQDMLRGWTEAVEHELIAVTESGRAAALAHRYADSFPASYRTTYGPAEAARDIERMRRLGTDSEALPLKRDARLYRLKNDAAHELRLKIYQAEGSMPLSDAVPALENFGFRVLAEVPTELQNGTIGTIHDFRLSMADSDDATELLHRDQAIENAISAVINGTSEDDVFNRLVIDTALKAEEANWLRAIYRYLRQTGMGFTIYTVVDALSSAKNVTRALTDLLRARHDPEFDGDREQACEQAEEAVRDGLSHVAAINDDRLLRLYRAVIKAVLRTNAFAPAGNEALAFKLNSPEVPNLPKPVPWREIFVYSRRVEGIHLRAGPVARGGLRWSDRRDDFRTEVLGLMKAQRVKNAVIVPTGAKGGFYPKLLPDPSTDRDGWAAEGKASYQIFIRSLLSITDNIVDDAVVHPDNVVILDGEDPYFVVAADKGTASFSDVANAIAAERDFWLDDAFASGGSHGYDHKAMGITARGAWISVQRHFLEMGVDVQKDPVRVIGCGDMSGDVFGNGMLLSKSIKLVAAFDHRHIFLDPDPDPAASWEERKRLFDLPRSSWADYDESLISSGGGAFARSMKQIPLSEEIRTLLGIEATELDPDSLISAILKAQVDLLWFGGIGTYVKAAYQNNIEVGDPTNDSLRINGRDLNVKVVGEGANLGVTQAGRIEFALQGGRINADFIDNSAGVDCSDNEVNIKIALAAAQRKESLSDDDRNAFLEEMTEDVSQLVLEDNRLQALALSIAEQGGARAIPAQMRLIETLEEIGDLDRRTEGLADAETLSRRASDDRGLTRPELAILLSSAKLALQAALEGSGISEDPSAVPLLLADFPSAMQDRFRQQIINHQLRDEIVATTIANQVINRMGLVQPFELAEEEGASLSKVGAAFLCASRIFDMPSLWHDLETADMSEPARLELFDLAALALRGHMADLIRAGAGDVPSHELIEQLSPAVGELKAEVNALISKAASDHAEAIITRLSEQKAPQDLATRVAELFKLDGAIGLARLSRDTGIPAERLTVSFTELGERLALDWAQGKAALMDPSDPWERLLVAGLARDFQQMRFDFLEILAQRKDAGSDPAFALDVWAESHDAGIKHFRSMINRAQSSSPVSPAMLAQIASQARNLLKS